MDRSEQIEYARQTIKTWLSEGSDTGHLDEQGQALIDAFIPRQREQDAPDPDPTVGGIGDGITTPIVTASSTTETAQSPSSAGTPPPPPASSQTGGN